MIIYLAFSVPTKPPSAVHIDATSPHLLLHWKAPLLEFRNGRLVAYEVECSWVDVSHGFTESWSAMSTEAVSSIGTVFRGRVRAWTFAGAGPWSDFETLSLKELGEISIFSKCIGVQA